MDLPSKIAVPMTVVEMTPEDVKLFIAFQKHHKLIEILEDVDASNIKGGFITIHFTNGGEIGSVDVQRRYRIIH